MTRKPKKIDIYAPMRADPCDPPGFAESVFAAMDEMPVAFTEKATLKKEGDPIPPRTGEEVLLAIEEKLRRGRIGG